MTPNVSSRRTLIESKLNSHFPFSSFWLSPLVRPRRQREEIEVFAYSKPFRIGQYLPPKAGFSNRVFAPKMVLSGDASATLELVIWLSHLLLTNAYCFTTTGVAAVGGAPVDSRLTTLIETISLHEDFTKLYLPAKQRSNDISCFVFRSNYSIW